MFHRMTRALLGAMAVALLSLATSVRAGQYQVATATLGGPGPCSATWINDSGDVAGTGYMQNGLQHAFLFSGGTIQALDLPGGSYSVCVGLNPQGWVLGESMKGTPASPGGFIGYFLYADGVTDNLGTSYPSGLILSDDFGDVNLGTPNLTEPLSSLFPSWYYAQANAANSSGQIAGDGVNGNGDPVVFLLTPVPEPSTLALLAVSAIALIGYVWHRRRMARSLLGVSAAVAVLLVASATISRANTFPILADSVADFSGNQGQNGWYYGYNRQPGGPFTELSYYPSIYGAWGNGNSPWGTAGFVEIGSDWQQSNALYSSSADPYADWSDRRWVSDVSGSILISGSFGCPGYPPLGDDGVVGEIWIDNQEVWSQASYHEQPATYSATGFVNVGSSVYFILNPNRSDISDQTTWTAQISTVPEPSTFALLAFAGTSMLAYAWRRKRLQSAAGYSLSPR
jgi:hypothetical protein